MNEMVHGWPRLFAAGGLVLGSQLIEKTFGLDVQTNSTFAKTVNSETKEYTLNAKGA